MTPRREHVEVRHTVPRLVEAQQEFMINVSHWCESIVESEEYTQRETH